MIAYVGLGSNLGDREANVRAAVERLGLLPDTSVRRVSALDETEPVGVAGQGWFLNAVAEIETELSARQLLWNLLRIERDLGRVRRGRHGPRTMDLDLLLYGALVVEKPDLRVPHLELLHRAFALVPLVELDPHLVHHETGETLLVHLGRLGQGPTVRRTAR